MGKEEAEEQLEEEAQRLRALAEAKYKDSNLKLALTFAKRAHQLCPSNDGLSAMVTAFKILRAASKCSSTPDWYKILRAEPFCHFNTIKKQYKKLALILHPDKNPHAGSEEAFKLVSEGFRFLSDKIQRKEYDVKLRIQIQNERMKGSEESVWGDTFWTACSTCRLLHQFERKYLGHNLVCPSCRKSFEAVEVGSDEDGGPKDGDSRVFRSERLKMRDEKLRGLVSKPIMGIGKVNGGRSKTAELKRKVDSDCGSLGSESLRQRMSSVGDIMERSKPKRAKIDDEMMTLAELQSQVRQKAQKENMESKQKDRKEQENMKKDREQEKEICKISKGKRELKVERRLELKKRSKESGGTVLKKNSSLAFQTQKGSRERDLDIRVVDLKVERRSKSRKGSKGSGGALSRKCSSLALQMQKGSRGRDVDIMAVEDSDFYDFDKDRVEKSFKLGQVWAIYDDDDGMPRHYCLINEVVSLNPFEVNISWLDLQYSTEEHFLGQERLGFHVPCGRYKVSRKTSVDSLNFFSHRVDCERAAKEAYRIYPKKGSVWALYKESSSGEVRSYDIVVFLTTYSEMHGLSMAYLEKVDGFKTIFKRREIGAHAIRWLEKDDVGLFSHQIPARKLSGDEAPELSKDCWELDPASLPKDLIRIQ